MSSPKITGLLLRKKQPAIHIHSLANRFNIIILINLFRLAFSRNIYLLVESEIIGYDKYYLSATTAIHNCFLPIFVNTGGCEIDCLDLESCVKNVNKLTILSY